MNRTSLIICLAASMAATVGCSSKNYVKQQTTPLINKTNELDDMTAKNTKDIKDVDARAQAGIAAVNAKTADVEQKAQSAGQNATQAQQVADAANARVGVLTNTVANLDNYRPVAETSVKFGFNKDNLTPKATEALDQLAGSISTTKGYIIALEGSTDSVGSADYNYDLSQRRADAIRAHVQDQRLRVRLVRHDPRLRARQRDRPVAQVVDRHRAQRARDPLARRQQHVHLTRVRRRRDLLRHRDQLVRRLAARRQHRHHAVAVFALAHDPARRALDALRVRHRRAAELHHDQRRHRL